MRELMSGNLVIGQNSDHKSVIIKMVVRKTLLPIVVAKKAKLAQEHARAVLQ